MQLKNTKICSCWNYKLLNQEAFFDKLKHRLRLFL
nr:MAG TPA: hypothetical protein [Caudoviricetes sp.]DAV56996.1 MAG TPA: hypothetical protein [Caudoviricetes sp.]